MLSLFANENMKLYRRPRTWILIALMAAIVLLTGVLMKGHEQPTPANWKQALIVQNQQLRQEAAGGGRHLAIFGHGAAQLEVQIQTNDYAISHNVPPQQPTGWSFSNQVEQEAVGVLLTVFVAIIAGDIVAGEFTGGTIKLLLTRAQTRSRILLSKYLAVLLFSIVLMAVTLGVSLLVGGGLFGFTGASAPYIYMSATGHVAQMNMIAYLFANYGFNSISLLMTVTIAFMISTIFRSSSIAIALSIVSLFIGNTIVRVLSTYSWDKYILFANTNLAQYFFNGPAISGMTLTFSVVVLAVYFIVMNGLSWYIFRKRDVALT
ncbi:MAG: ABC transporter permease [Firmicutes bacterium]|nr:ABC transporter permease [Bacillota bacterium]